jgi:ribonuclease-3
MKDQIVLPPKIEFSISDDFTNLLFQKLGNCKSESLPWIAISLVHPSYLNEHSVKFPVHTNVLDRLGSLGASFMNLILFDIAHLDKNLTEMIEYAQFVTNNKSQIMETIFEEFDLVKFALIGKGEKENISSKVKFTIGRQFVGALVICFGCDIVKSVVYQLTQKISLATEYLDCKTILQEYSQRKKMGSPIYEIIRQSGPDHSRVFVMKVSTIDGKFAHAKGKSKQEASKKAAFEYIKQFVPALLANKTNHLQKNIVKATESPLFVHKDFVFSICKIFNVEQEKAWAFSQSLTHPSFVNETTIRQVIDYRKHAQLGAKVLEAFFTQQILFLALENSDIDEITIEQYRSLLNREEYSCEGFDLLNLQNGVLLGAGEKKAFQERISGKAEFFQAVIGAAFKNHGSWKTFINNMPKILEDWFAIKLQVVQKNDFITDFDPSGGLQAFLQAIRLSWEYKYLESGLGHQREHKAQLLLQSTITSETFLLKSEKALLSKKLAVRHMASVVLKAIDIVNSAIGVDTKNPYEGSKELVEFSKFLLFHELSIHPSNVDIIRWQKLGVLGSQLLLQGKMYEFKLWAITAGTIVQNKNIPPNALSLYSSIPQISEKDQIEYKASIMSIGSFVENLSPEIESADIRLSDEFDKIVKLSKVYKLLSQKWGMIKLQQIVDDLFLLRRGRSPELKFEPNIPDILISEKEGTYQTIFLYILELVENLKPESKKNVLSILFEFEAQKSELNITFSFEEPIVSSEKILLHLNSDILWKYLYTEATVSNIHADASKICISTRIFSPDNTFASQALDAYKRQNSLAKTENQISSQLLHDLKNQLIAYQVSIGGTGKDRTSILKSKFEASQHLDNALVICRSLEVVSNSMVSPTIESVDIGEFIKQYIAEKLTAFPSNIRLETPKTIGSSIVYTSRSFLKAIFENLTKNAVEAMPDGGEIRIDWLYDEIGELLLIDISDTGPGLQPEILDRIKSGKIIDSSKHKGSGIGILSVQSMAERLGGRCTVSSNLGKGTQWNITLPSMSPKEVVEISNSDETLGDFADNEVELQ